MTPRLVVAGATVMVAALATCLAALGDTVHLSGKYVVVAVRAASDVATPHGPAENEKAQNLVGTELQFLGNSVTWYQGRHCDVRRGNEASSAAQVDPNLSDLQIVPGRSDQRINMTLVVDCLGRAITDIWEGLAVDDRVLVLRSSTAVTYLVLEKPLTSKARMCLAKGLQGAGLIPGPVDGAIDNATRTAVAAFARRHGASFQFAPGIITRNVLDALCQVD